MGTVVNEEEPKILDSHRPSLDGDHDPHFDPIITLPEVKVKTFEEEETILHRVRAKLFRYDKINNEWKERGTGDAKLLHHVENKTVRILMRRDKTLKLCANHYVTPTMTINPKSGSDRVWVWTTNADAADGVSKSEILAMRFMNAEAAIKWKEKFEESKALIEENADAPKKKKSDKNKEASESETEDSEADEVTGQVQNMSIKEVTDKNTERDQNEEKNEEEKGFIPSFSQTLSMYPFLPNILKNIFNFIGNTVIMVLRN